MTRGNLIEAFVFDTCDILFFGPHLVVKEVDSYQTDQILN